MRIPAGGRPKVADTVGGYAETLANLLSWIPGFVCKVCAGTVAALGLASREVLHIFGDYGWKAWRYIGKSLYVVKESWFVPTALNKLLTTGFDYLGNVVSGMLGDLVNNGVDAAAS